MSKLVVLSGIPGSGKSYFSGLLKKIKRKHVYVVSSDTIRELITGDQADLTSDQIMWQMFYELPKVYALDKEGIVLLDATHASVKYRVDAIKDITSYFDEVSLVMFKLDKKIVDHQNIEREHPVPQFVLDKFYNTFEDVSDKDRKVFKHIYVIKDVTNLAAVIDQF